jgi:hypothetical protein
MIDMNIWGGWFFLLFFIFGLILGYFRGRQIGRKDIKIEIPKEVKFKLKNGKTLTFKSRRASQ